MTEIAALEQEQKEHFEQCERQQKDYGAKLSLLRKAEILALAGQRQEGDASKAKAAVEARREAAFSDPSRGASTAAPDLGDDATARAAITAEMSFADRSEREAVYDLFMKFAAGSKNGLLSKEMYKAYLKGIGVWGESPYTEDRWEEKWPMERDALRHPGDRRREDGINYESFSSMLYGDGPRGGWAVDDLAIARETEAEEMSQGGGGKKYREIRKKRSKKSKHKKKRSKKKISKKKKSKKRTRRR